jgi:hypothetical protein
MKLDQKGMAMAEYIWIDAEGGVRSKSKVSLNNKKIPTLPARTPKSFGQWRKIVSILVCLAFAEATLSFLFR